jgi:DNA helicase II / ATP-dependent DNA helicase PcrA
VAAEARVMLLGDPNQCIYSSLPGSVGVSPERLDRACELAGTEGVVRLSEASHRDPSGVIPASAAAILRRDFTSPAIRTAISTGRLTVRAGLPPEDEARIVAETVQDLRSGGRSVAVFSHHNDMLANLSDALQRAGIAHEIAGLSDSLAAALAVQLDMLRFSSGQCEWNEVLGSLAVFVTSATRPVRGQRVPALAYQILSGSGTAILDSRMYKLKQALQDAEPREALEVGSGAHSFIGLPSKLTAWQYAAGILRRLYARVSHDGRRLSSSGRVQQLARAASEESIAILTYVADDPQQIQLMNLHQTKGREADATVVVLRAGDWFGNSAEPYLETSRLLYVVFSRAREKIVVLLFGHGLPGEVAPLATFAS